MNNEQLVARIQSGDNKAENMLQLWQQNYGFIHKMAGQYLRYAERDDLEQEAYIGLCEAVQHYDSAAGANFIGYASFWIKNAMLECARGSKGVNVPQNTVYAALRYKKIFAAYRSRYGRNPSDAGMMVFLGVDDRELARIKKAVEIGQIRSLDETVKSEDGETPLLEFVPSDELLEEDCIHREDYREMKRSLWETVDGLPDHQGRIIRERYQQGKTYRETGAGLGMNPERVRQEQSKALRALRQRAPGKKYLSYAEEYLQYVSRRVSVASFQRTGMSAVEWEVFDHVGES